MKTPAADVTLLTSTLCQPHRNILSKWKKKKSLDDNTLKATIDQTMSPLNSHANLTAAIFFSILIAIRWDVCNYRRCYYLQLKIAWSTGGRDREAEREREWGGVGGYFAIAAEKQLQSKSCELMPQLNGLILPESSLAIASFRIVQGTKLDRRHLYTHSLEQGMLSSKKFVI